MTSASAFAAAFDGPGGCDAAVTRAAEGVTVLHTHCARVPIDGVETYVGRLAQFDIIVRHQPTRAHPWSVGQIDARPCFVDGRYVERTSLYGTGPTLAAAEAEVMEEAERRRDAGREPAEAIEWARGVASRGL